jgi:hypothetical protein
MAIQALDVNDAKVYIIDRIAKKLEIVAKVYDKNILA